MKNEQNPSVAPAVYARPNRFEINLDAVAACTRQIRLRLGEDVQFFATLKSNAYGYGVLPVAHTVLRSGADALSLASLEDAIALRQSGIRVHIRQRAGPRGGRDW
ncbi:alanine racemase [Paraburkholderia dilworthii]|uniref:alanine racemase n=1 Tax=Paraburkholderia dilworthii TaxID=948106 RepID=UPI000483E303|nr:alanine racemase [Paraburkholderia dilworthii]